MDNWIVAAARRYNMLPFDVHFIYDIKLQKWYSFVINNNNNSLYRASNDMGLADCCVNAEGRGIEVEWND